MRKARVEYPSGREVLKDYWGFLTSGGLIVGDRSFIGAAVGTAAAGGQAMPLDGPAEGEPVVLDVRIASLRKEYRLAGRVRRRSGGSSAIAFDAGQSQDALLNAAWADGEDVPERRHRRYGVNGQARYRVADREGVARLVDVSRGGCCLAATLPLRVGTRVFVELAGAWVEGRVRWSSGQSATAGVEFARFQEELVALLVGEPAALGAAEAAQV